MKRKSTTMTVTGAILDFCKGGLTQKRRGNGFEEFLDTAVQGEYDAKRRSYATFNINLAFLLSALDPLESVGQVLLSSTCTQCYSNNSTVFAGCHSMRDLGFTVHITDAGITDPAEVAFPMVRPTANEVRLVSRS